MTFAEYAQTLAAGFLAAVLAYSGSQKIQAPFAPALAMVRFGLVRRVRTRNGRLAGVVEVGVALALVAAPTSLWPYACATPLGILFVTIVAITLLRGREFGCACFGETSEPVSSSTLVRALFVLALASTGLACALLASTTAAFSERLLGVASGITLACIVSTSFALATSHPFVTRQRVAEAP